MKAIQSITLALFLSISCFAQQKQWSLKQCVDYALANNISIKQASLSTKIKKEDVTIARGNFYPSLSASVRQSFDFGSNIDLQTNSRKSSDRRSNSFSVNTSVSLFDGFRNLNVLKQSKIALKSSSFDLEKMKNDISLNVLNAYLNVLFNKETIKTAKSQVKISKEQLEKTTKLVKAGVQPKGNLLDVEATYASDQEKLVNAQNGLDLALLNLTQLLQLPKNNFDVKDVTIKIPTVSLITNNPNVIFEKAVKSKPEIKSAELNLESSKMGIKIAESAYLPSLNLSYSLNTFYNHLQGQSDNFINPITNEVVDNSFFTQLDNNLGHSVGLSLRIPIFNKFLTKSNVNKAKINVKISKYQLENQKLKLREAIERAFTDAKSSLKSYEAAKKSLVAQNESFRYAQEKFSLGVLNPYDFNQIKNRLFNDKIAVVRSKYDFLFKSKLLEFYYGIPIVID